MPWPRTPNSWSASRGETTPAIRSSTSSGSPRCICSRHGVFYPEVVNVLGPGVALNVPGFLREEEALVRRGVPRPQLYVSDRAQVVLPYHLLLDEYEEERRGAQQFGSTRRGIAPFYSDKYAKLGIQVADLYDPARLRGRLELALASKNTLATALYGKPALQIDRLLEELLRQGEAIRPFVRDTTALLRDALASRKKVLLEGQLGALRDPDHGIYPYTTSSSPLAGFATVGAGIPPQAITEIIAVAKAYSSCVGAGAFVSEIHAAEAQELRDRGGDAGEYGATTGRPRRMGWFDAVATRYGCSVQGATCAALTLLDVLGYRDEIPVCTGYEVDGEVIHEFPATAILDRARPRWELLPGWRTDISRARRFAELPLNAQRYVSRIEELIQTRIRWISVGPERSALIERG